MKSEKLKILKIWQKGFTLSLSKGFTLIELLVVMAIIGILAALTLTGFGAARKNARDTQRKSDLQQYHTALEAYASNNSGVYPAVQSRSCGGDPCSPGGIFANPGPLIPLYLPDLIQDPTVEFNAHEYFYDYYTVAGVSAYSLRVPLETGERWEICSDGRAGKPGFVSGNIFCGQCCVGSGATCGACS